MKRLINTLRLDSVLQARNKVYLIIGIAALALGYALNALFTPEQLHYFMPVVVLGSVSLTTVFLVGVLILLERGEGTLDVVLVSPLRSAEYLASKLITLTLLALVESGAIAIIAYGFGFSFGWLIVAVTLRASMGVAVGVAVGVRYRSITHFLLPAILVSLSFDLPNIWYLNLSTSPAFYLWPSMPPLLLAKAAFMPIDPIQLIYSFVYGALALTALHHLELVGLAIELEPCAVLHRPLLPVRLSDRPRSRGAPGPRRDRRHPIGPRGEVGGTRARVSAAEPTKECSPRIERAPSPEVLVSISSGIPHCERLESRGPRPARAASMESHTAPFAGFDKEVDACATLHARLSCCCSWAPRPPRRRIAT